MKFVKPIAFAAGAVMSLLALMAPAQAIDASDRAEIEKIVREYLLANPKILGEMQKAYEEQQKLEQVALQQKTIAEKRAALFESPSQMVVGNPDAKITIVEFYDYNCGFCQRALEDMNRIVDERKDVKFVLKEFPILGPQSVEAHKISLAFNTLHPDKSAEFHRRLLSAEGRKDRQMAVALGVELGADANALAEESNKPYIIDAMREVYELGDGLGITGTPSYVIGEEVVFGAVGFDALNSKVANVASCGKTTC